jgi:microcystin-dependent protein
MSAPFLGQITMFGGNFAPRGYAFCNGQLMPISQNDALYSLIGTNYGGDGSTTFALPNMQSRLSVHMGQGPSLSPYVIGQAGGSSEVTITSQTMPSHNHLFLATTGPADTATIGSGVVPATANGARPAAFYGTVGQGDPPLIPHPMNSAVCGMTGGGQPHGNLMPSQCITFIIALQGIFPSRN